MYKSFMNYVLKTSVYLLFYSFDIGYHIYNRYNIMMIKKIDEIYTNIHKKTENVYNVEFTRNLHHYTFDFVASNKEDLDKVIINVKNNLVEKDHNKNKISYAALMNNDEDLLCDILVELRLFKYYFDVPNGNAKWNHLLQIMREKYPTHLIDPEQTFLYIIYNDDNFTETTTLLSSILHESIVL